MRTCIFPTSRPDGGRGADGSRILWRSWSLGFLQLRRLSRSPLRQKFPPRREERRFFLREPRGGSTSAVRSGKEPLIAQEEEEKSLIWGPRRCSSLQPHAELISTRAKDRKEETARRKRREVCWWAVDSNGAVLLPSSSSPTSDFCTAVGVKINI